MKEVRYSEYIVGQLAESIGQLVERGYFSEEEYAISYMRDVTSFFQLNLNQLISTDAPDFFQKYGNGHPLRYVAYRKSKRTTWYAFYYETDDQMNIVYLGTNHLIGHHLNINL